LEKKKEYSYKTDKLNVTVRGEPNLKLFVSTVIRITNESKNTGDSYV